MSDIVEIIDRYGRRRRAKKGEVLQDGERFSIPMTFMDAQLRDALVEKFGDSVIRVVDAGGAPAGHRPGFLFDSGDRTLADAAQRAYDARTERMTRKRRRPGDDDDDDDDNKGDDRRRAARETGRERRQALARKAAVEAMGKDARQPTLDELEAITAYNERSERMRNSWRRP